MIVLRCPTADVLEVGMSNDILIPESKHLERRLNEAKSRITPFFKKDEKAYSSATRLTDRYVRLKKIVSDEMGGQHVTNAWLKIYEIMYMFHLGKCKTSTSLKSAHLCEAPGAFVSGINHFLRTVTPIKDWKWMAQSLIQADEETMKNIVTKKADVSQLKALDDSYGLIKRFPNNWDFGDGSGDITSVRNMHYYQSLDFKAHLVTSDVGLDMSSIQVSDGESFNQQEQLLAKLNACQIITGLHLLAYGGDCVFKTFTFFYPLSISLIYLLCSSFEKVWFSKPVTSRPANSEIYIVCKGFMTLPDSYLFDLRETVDKLDINKSLFKNIPEEFYSNILNLQKVFVLKQITAIEENIKVYHEYTKDRNQITKIQNELSNTASRKWIDTYGIRPLFTKNRL